MVPDAYVNHVPVMTGGAGREELAEFYSRYFVPQMPPDTEIVPVSRTVGGDRIVDEMIFRFTHTIDMEWMLPGVPPAGKRVEIALVVIVGFRDGLVAHEHIYWDQASVLAQLGLLEPGHLPTRRRRGDRPQGGRSDPAVERAHQARLGLRALTRGFSFATGAGRGSASAASPLRRALPAQPPPQSPPVS
jgi:hypothetical protein